MVKRIESKEEFDRLLEEGKALMVDFYADWCGPCKKISPEIDLLAETYKSIKFVKVNVDELEPLSAEYNISAMPTFVFFYNGKKVNDVVGASIAKVKEALDKLLNMAS